MHNKYAKDGLVAITLSLDLVREEKMPVERGLMKLKERNVEVTNFIIDEGADLLKEKLRYEGGLPMVYVFNRSGKWKLFDGDDVKYDLIEQTVRRFLDEK